MARDVSQVLGITLLQLTVLQHKVLELTLLALKVLELTVFELKALEPIGCKALGPKGRWLQARLPELRFGSWRCQRPGFRRPGLP